MSLERVEGTKMDRAKGWKKYVEQSEKLVIETFDESVIDKNFVKNLRNRHNFTQNVFAKIVGVSKKTIEKWEQGSNPVNDSSKRLLYLFDKRPSVINDIYSEKILIGSKFIKASNIYDLQDNEINYFENVLDISLGAKHSKCNKESNETFDTSNYKMYATVNTYADKGIGELWTKTDHRLAS